MVTYARADVVFSQGEPRDTVMYVRRGEIQLSVLSQTTENGFQARLPPTMSRRTPWKRANRCLLRVDAIFGRDQADFPQGFHTSC